MEELRRRLPEYLAFSDQMKAEADKARIANAEECPEGTSSGSGTVEPDPPILPSVKTGKNKPSSPNKGGKPKAPPLQKTPGETPPEPTIEGETDTQPTTTGFARKRNAAASSRKASGKTPAGTKRKKATVDNDEEGSGEHPGLLFPKTPRTGKRQRLMKEESLGMASSAGGNDSGSGDMDREMSARPVGVRRTTRATSGTPGPGVGLAAPVARKVGRPRGRQVGDEDYLEEEEEAAEILRSPAKRGRQSPAKKVAK